MQLDECVSEWAETTSQVWGTPDEKILTIYSILFYFIAIFYSIYVVVIKRQQLLILDTKYICYKSLFFIRFYKNIRLINKMII